MFAYLSKFARQDRSVLLYIFTSAAVGFTNFGVVLVLFNLYIIKLGFDLAFVGILNATAMIVWALFAVPAGWFGARFGLRGSLVIGNLIIAVFFAIFLSIAWLPRLFWSAGLLVSLGIIYVGASLIAVNGSPYLMAICPEKDRHTAFALQTAILTLFGFLGSLAAGFLPEFLMRQLGPSLSEPSAFNAVMWLGVLSYFGAALLVFKARSAPSLVQETKILNRETAPFGLLFFFGCPVFTAVKRGKCSLDVYQCLFC